jgi:hypothetical protein
VGLYQMPQITSIQKTGKHESRPAATGRPPGR